VQNDSSRQWAVLTPTVSGDILTAQAKQVEAAGMAGIQAIQVYGPPWIPLAHCGAVTERVQLATGIANAFTRSPFETALAALDLDMISGGRFVLGLGPSIQAWTEGFYGSPYGQPISRLRETVEIIRLVWQKGHTGELERYEGKHWQHDWTTYLGSAAPPLRTDIPIWLGANQMAMVRCAAEIGDGLFGHPIWSVPWTLEHAIPTLEAALHKAGRQRSDIHFNAWYWVVINPDRTEALEDARATVAFYAGMIQYEPFFTAHGFQQEARACQAAVEHKDLAVAVKAVTDEMAATFVILGSADEVRQKLGQVWDVADSFTLVAPITLPPEKMLFYINNIAETFYC